MIPTTRSQSQSVMPDRVSAQNYGPHRLVADNASGHIEFTVKYKDFAYIADLDRDVFLDAVRKLGVIVIEESDLPGVKVEEREIIAQFMTGGTPQVERRFIDVNTANLRARANALLALANYADSQPPLDEEKVKTLANLLDLAAAGTVTHSQSTDVARNLLLTRRVEVTG